MRRLLRARRLPGHKVGREWRLHKEALDHFLAGRDDELSPEDWEAIRRGLEDIRAGRVVPWETLREELQW